MSAIAVLERRVEEMPDPGGGAARPSHIRDRRRHCTIVRIEGELDASVAGVFHKALGQAVTASSHAVVLDLRWTRFLSIGMARSLATAKLAAAATGVDLRIVGERPEVERVLEVTGRRPLFRRYSSVQAALTA
ncbi:STAS domain-containing protein [Nocardia mexicana]|uniref:Anti-anti-sigma factor n=1 Tax=Nocardia mexicana TaxID=279262 RepID=A0A370HF55_9NOCA|nr:STAS domain-containing protein [Nocardia mexicana]RDI55868.1 anti-anti-sigma factor [Nocardia mexicana]